MKFNKELLKKQYGVSKLGDPGSIAEELLEGVSELESSCYVVKMCVEDETFSLEEALEVYQLSKEDY